jgi:hypothetical protein
MEKRALFDVLRRAVDNTIANWPLILIRIGEMIVFGVLAVITVIAAFVPILISVGVELTKLRDLEDLESAGYALMEKWPLLLWMVAAILVLMLIMVAVHAFVSAGCSRVNVDGERTAGASMTGPRARFRAFSMQRWMAGAKDGWWTLFWVYNITWSIAGFLMLIPVVPTGAAVLLLRDQEGFAIAIGCIGLVVTVMLMFLVTIYTAMWVARSVNEWAAHGFGIRASLSAGRAAIRTDLGRHLLIFIAVVVVSLAGSSFFSSFSFFAALGEIGSHRGPFEFDLFFMPLRLLGTLLNIAFSAVVSAWSMAAYASLAAE